MSLEFSFLLFFLLSSGCRSQVAVFPPDQLISTPGGSASFNCYSLNAGSSAEDTIISTNWLVNGTRLDFLNLGENVTTRFNEEFNTGRLDFDNLPMTYNGTRIQCIATFHSGITLTSTGATLLLIQGLLSAVGSFAMTVQDSTISLTWTAPSTLDIPSENPDIRGYCVDIFNSSSYTLVHSECGINDTLFNYPTPDDGVCHIYMFTVTPVNVVGNGTKNTISYFGVESRPRLLDVVRTSVLPGDMYSYSITMSAGVCRAELTFVDLDTRQTIALKDTDLTIAENTITFTTEKLRNNHHYIVTVIPINIAGSSTSFETISTHDIVDVTSMKTPDNEIELSTVYSEHSDASGALLNFVFIDDNGDVNFTRSVLLALDKQTSLNHILPFDLYPGQYRVFVYDIESDGTLYNGVGYPAGRDDLTVPSQGSPFLSEFIDISSCQITTSLDVISAVCTFPRDTMATGLKVIAQLSNSSEVHKLHINQSMDLQTPVTVEVEESGTYQVTIFGIRDETGIFSSNVKHAEEVMVGTTPVTVTLPSEGLDKGSGNSGTLIGVGVGVPIATISIIVFAVLVVIVGIALHKKRSFVGKMKVSQNSQHNFNAGNHNNHHVDNQPPPNQMGVPVNVAVDIQPLPLAGNGEPVPQVIIPKEHINAAKEDLPPSNPAPNMPFAQGAIEKQGVAERWSGNGNEADDELTKSIAASDGNMTITVPVIFGAGSQAGVLKKYDVGDKDENKAFSHVSDIQASGKDKGTLATSKGYSFHSNMLTTRDAVPDEEDKKKALSQYPPDFNYETEQPHLELDEINRTETGDKNVQTSSEDSM